METEDVKLKARQIREREYHAFLDLYRGDNAAFLNLPSSPCGIVFNRNRLNSDPTRRIEALYCDVYASAYLRHFDLPALRGAFKALETILADAPGVTIGHNDLGRKRRELRFLHRFAQIVRWKDYERCPPNPKEQRSRCERIAEMCLSLEALLLDQLEDEHVLRKLHTSDLTALPELIKQLGRFGEVFENIELDLPYKRNRIGDNSVMRLVLNDLAECCFQIYEGCTYEVLRALLKSCWLHSYAAIRRGELTGWIDVTLERKQTDYEARTAPREDGLPAPNIRWMPVRSL